MVGTRVVKGNPSGDEKLEALLSESVSGAEAQGTDHPFESVPKDAEARQYESG